MKEWYVRVRGQVTGPFTAEEVEAFQARGQLQPYHEVSRDQLTWQAVGTARLREGGAAPAAELPDLPPVPPVAAEPIPGRSLLPRGARAAVAVACLASALFGAAVVWVLDTRAVRQAERDVQDQESIRDKLETQLSRLSEREEELKQRLKRAEDDTRGLMARLDEVKRERDKLDGRLATAQADAARARQEAADRLRLATEEADRQRKEVERLRAQLAQATAAPAKPADAPPKPAAAAKPADAARAAELASLLDQARQAVRDYAAARARDDVAASVLARARAVRLLERVDEAEPDADTGRQLELLRRTFREIERGN